MKQGDLLRNAMKEGRISDAEAIINEMDNINYAELRLAIELNQPYLLNVMLDRNPGQMAMNLALSNAFLEHYAGNNGALEAAETLIAEGAVPKGEDLSGLGENVGIDLAVAKLIIPNLGEISSKTTEMLVKNPLTFEAILTGKIKVNQAQQEALIASAPIGLLVAIGERNPQLLEAMLTGKIKISQALQGDLIAAAPAELLVAIGGRNPQLLEAMLTGKIKMNQAKHDALIAATPTEMLGAVIGKDVPSARSEKVAANDALVHAVLRGNVKEAQALILHGASADVVNKDGSKPGLKLVDYMKYGAERAAKEGRTYDEKGMEALIGAYDAVEKQFKDKFETKVLAAVKNLGPDPSTEKVAEVFNKALADAYKPGFADKVKPVVTATIVEDCKLDFIDNFIIAFKSLVSEKTFDELRDMKLVDRMYKEVQHTRAFQELASPEIGKAATLKSHVAGIEAEKARAPGQGGGVVV